MLVDIPLWRAVDYHQTGSTVICSPPIATTDVDYVVLVDDKKMVSEYLKTKDWKLCGNEAYENPDSRFIALRKGILNYILVDNPDDYDRWEAAMLLAKHRNLLDKADRIKLFRTIKAGAPNPKKTKLEINNAN